MTTTSNTGSTFTNFTFDFRAYGFATPPAPPADDPHAVLGLPRSATKQEITRRFRQLAREHHPDHGGDAAKMVQITNAYNALREGA